MAESPRDWVPPEEDWERKEEALAVALGLVQRIWRGTLPPDDAYAWTRILCHELRMVGILTHDPE